MGVQGITTLGFDSIIDHNAWSKTNIERSHGRIGAWCEFPSAAITVMSSLISDREENNTRTSLEGGYRVYTNMTVFQGINYGLRD